MTEQISRAAALAAIEAIRHDCNGRPRDAALDDALAAINALPAVNCVEITADMVRFDAAENCEIKNCTFVSLPTLPSAPSGKE